MTALEPHLRQTAALIQARIDQWGLVPHVLRDALGDASPAEVALALDALCRVELGAPIAASTFFEASVGSVHGLRLRDGRELVVKLHAPHVSTRHLDAVQAAQRLLAAGGFPVPVPLLPPTPVGAGVATAESLLAGGEVPDGHRPEARRALASALARVVALCRPLTAEPGFREHAMTTPPDELWPRPHDGRFDFARSATGAEWIDAIAAAALPPQETDAGVDVVGHTDLRAEHVLLEGDVLTAVYDWDSLALYREPVLVGIVAHGFTANWRAPTGHRQFPALAEVRAYVADYERARGAPFTADERRMLDASLVYTMAYTARCEHTDAVLDFGRRARPATPPATVPEGGARAFLAAHAAELLGADVDLREAPRVGYS